MAGRPKKTESWKRYAKIRYSADLRGKDFALSYTQYIPLYGKPCEYCGKVSDDNGLDRVDSDKGYYIDNVVSCCHHCNIMKYTYSTEDFLYHCKKIINHSRQSARLAELNKIVDDALNRNG